MRSNHRIAGKRKPLLMAILVGCVAVAVGKAADLSGTYVDTGTRIASSISGSLAEEPSLYALLRFEFEPDMVRVLRERTATVKIAHSRHVIEVAAFDADGLEIWSALWAEGETFSEQEKRVVVRSPAGRFGDDKIILILERLAEHEFLQVSVQRIVPTMFGPAARKVDTLLFQLAP